MNWFSNTFGPSAAPAWELAADALIVDVRSPLEYASGHVKGAINLPLDQFAQRYQQVMPQPDQQVILYCRSGARSGQACQFLQQNGYTKVINGINADEVARNLGK